MAQAFHPISHSGAQTGPHHARGDDPALTNAELVQLRVRVIALENMVIALLANAPPSQQALAREMASYISPRPGYTLHTVTIHAADQMRSLVDRADRFQSAQPN